MRLITRRGAHARAQTHEAAQYGAPKLAPPKPHFQCDAAQCKESVQKERGENGSTAPSARALVWRPAQRPPP